MHNNDYKYDLGIIEAVYRYYTHGLQPGSCTYAMICGDIYRAFESSHPNIKKCYTWKNTMDIIHNILPIECLGPENYAAWIKHGGLNGADELTKSRNKSLGVDDKFSMYL